MRRNYIMNIKTQYKESDGGRTASGFGYEHNDCVVRALAHAYEIPYAEAHAKMKALGRKDRKPTYYMRDKINEGFKFKLHINFDNKKKITLKTFLKKNYKGNYLIRIRGHALAINDGVLVDSYLPRLGSHILDIWYVK